MTSTATAGTSTPFRSTSAGAHNARSERTVVIGERALKALRAYLRIRRAKEGVDGLFTTDEGPSLTYWGGQNKAGTDLMEVR
jgi:hypothetical protein